jgi:hypothetical protein
VPGLAQRGDVHRRAKIVPDVNQVPVPPERPALIVRLALIAVCVEKEFRPVYEREIKAHLLGEPPRLVTDTLARRRKAKGSVTWRDVAYQRFGFL